MSNTVIKSKEKAVPASPTSLISLAIEKGSDIDKLKELMDLQERWEKKEAKKAFLDAKAKFLSLVPVIRKNKTAKVQMKSGGFYNYKYADGGTIHHQIKDPLFECGLSYGFTMAEINGEIEVSCHLSHRDGHSETTTMRARPDDTGGKNNIQMKGSTITYLERYTLLGALGITTADEDNDGRGGKPVDRKQEDDTSEEDFLAQWQYCVNAVTTRAELTLLYTRNRKVVDENPAIQSMFKARQEQLPQSQKVAMP